MKSMTTMQSSMAWDEIKYYEFITAVKDYPKYVPDKLRELDETRLQTIPKTIQQRKSGGQPYMEKSELLTLVEWKLKHGTFRPNLLKLVSSNSDSSIKETTTSAFSSYSPDSPSASLPHLTQLSGIGPATASLILSTYDPTNAPFFSDELFRYLHTDIGADGKVTGWDRKIGYTKKEYEGLCDRVKQMRERLSSAENSVTAIDIEKAAWVLSAQHKSSAGGVSAGGVKAEHHDGEGAAAQRKKKDKDVASADVQDDDPPAKRRKTTRSKT